MLKIGDFSKLSRISIRMLRHYDNIGLLIPKNTDSSTGYRYYGEDQLPVAGQINALKDMGFGLSAIEEILKSYGDPHKLAEFLSVKHTEVQAEAAETARRLLLLETAIKRLRKDGCAMSYPVTLKTLPERYVASVRQIIPAYEQEGMLWQILREKTAPLNVQYSDPGCALAVFYDGEYKEVNVDVEVQLSVKGSYPDIGPVVFKTEPPILIASTTYQGGYDKICEVYESLANWVRDNGYDFIGPSINIYHISPHQTPNPEEWITEVGFPVKKK